MTGVSGAGKSSLINGILHPALRRKLLGSYDQVGRHAGSTGIDADRQGHRHRPEAHRPHAALEPGDLHQGLRPHPRACSRRRPRRAPPATSRGGSRSTSRAAAARPARATASARSRCTSCPTSTSPARCARGRRYNEATLRVKWKDASIAEVLETTRLRRPRAVPEPPPLRAILRTLDDVGLGYIALGQSATTLSGGEAQRIKLSRELAKRDTGRTLLPARRADHRPALRGRAPAAGRARPPGRGRQHRARHRAQPRRHQDRRLRHRPRPRGRRRAAARSSPPARPKRSRASPAPTPASSSRRCSACAAHAPPPRPEKR